MTASKLFLRLALPLAVTGLLCSASPAAACEGHTVKAIIYQAAKNGRVADGYSVACLRAAQGQETADLAGYTNADSAIQSAIARAVVAAQLPADQGTTTPSSSGRGAKPRRITRQLQGVPVVRPPSLAETGTPADPQNGPVTRLINAASHGPDAVPLPVLVLCSLAGLLMLAGGGSFLVRRRIEARRAEPPTAPH